MNFFGWEIARKTSPMSLDQFIRRIETINETASGISVTPENCMQSPTVQAIVTAVSRHLTTLPVRVLRKTGEGSRTSREELPNHPVAKLLSSPNDVQTSVSYWLDAVSWLVRYGNFYCFKARGETGPIRRLEPLVPSTVDVIQRQDLSIIYMVTRENGQFLELPPNKIHHARGP